MKYVFTEFRSPLEICRRTYINIKITNLAINMDFSIRLKKAITSVQLALYTYLCLTLMN